MRLPFTASARSIRRRGKDRWGAYSHLSATIGSTFVARRAGVQQASNATNVSSYALTRRIGTTMGIGAPKAHDLSLRYRAAEPVLKTRRADARVIARGEALIVQLYAEVERVDVCGHIPCVSGCAKELSDEFV